MPLRFPFQAKNSMQDEETPLVHRLENLWGARNELKHNPCERLHSITKLSDGLGPFVEIDCFLVDSAFDSL